MGALRFWFEVYCHAIGIPVKNYENEKVDIDKFQKSLKSNLRKTTDLDEAEDMALAKQDISLPSRIFGCTGWKGQIKIEDIKIKKVTVQVYLFIPLNKPVVNDYLTILSYSVFSFRN